ncbi:hypothetical protein Pyrfu_1427 [Pyrolobus fumarii 1A]|uniref:Dolichol kinase n=1 Tax=Pyrolobus fumarii (strain DSM 11204 / 1A) TaxID=694429 RepID=G0EH61_PYRF1|nr:hypothetical protein [Pyrolobus fumarii]AEM39285.1 hypothetical protein Pyrfu_1427 [Pyrolobus fumarii 1A]
MSPSNEALIGALLLGYVALIVILSKLLYNALRGIGLGYYRAVYFVRKYIHVFGGGVVAFLTPFVFTSPLIPLVMGLVLAAGLALARATNKLMYWFQVPDNAYEVNFCIAWALGIAILWLITGNPWIAVTPALLISIGDAVTGVVRNVVVGRRSKHWVGNLAMATVTVPLVGGLLGVPGMLVAAVASVIERLEFGPIDDNVLIVLFSSAALVVMHLMGLV